MAGTSACEGIAEMIHPPILICSFPRAGSTMTMRMLDAGGVEPYGNRISYEEEDLNLDRDMFTLLPKLQNKCAKILDPQVSRWPHRFNAYVIWLDRDVDEQAKSMIKFMRWQGATVASKAWRSIARSINDDRRKALDVFTMRAIPTLVLRFEQILSDRVHASARIAEFLNLPLDLKAMASVVKMRSPRCASTMEIEDGILRE